MKPESINARNEFIEKTKAKGSLVKQKCFLCSKDEFSIISEIDRYGFFYPTGMCNVCGNVQQTEYYNAESLTDFYTNYFRKIYENKTPNKLFLSQKNGNGISIYQFVSSIFKPKSVLEVGCGAGGILSVFKDNGSKVLGLDFDEDFLEAARENDVDVKNGSLEVLDESEKYDLIIFSHVLEHIVKPVEFLRELTKYLTKDGLIFIEVPSIDNIKKGDYELDLLNYWQNAHVIHFTTKSLELVCKSAGLEKVKSTESIRSCWKLSFEDSKITENEKDLSLKHSSELLKSIENKRKSFEGKLILFKRFIYTSSVQLLHYLKIRGLIKSILYKLDN